MSYQVSRCHETCHHGDRTAPTLLSAPLPEKPSHLEEFPPIHDDDGDPPPLEAYPSQANEDADDAVEEIRALAV